MCVCVCVVCVFVVWGCVWCCSSGLDQFCRFNQSDHCYRSSGHKLNLSMVLDASKYDPEDQKRINNTQYGPVGRVKNDR